MAYSGCGCILEAGQDFLPVLMPLLSPSHPVILIKGLQSHLLPGNHVEYCLKLVQVRGSLNYDGSHDQRPISYCLDCGLGASRRKG